MCSNQFYESRTFFFSHSRWAGTKSRSPFAFCCYPQLSGLLSYVCAYYSYVLMSLPCSEEPTDFWFSLKNNVCRPNLCFPILGYSFCSSIFFSEIDLSLLPQHFAFHPTGLFVLYFPPWFLLSIVGSLWALSCSHTLSRMVNIRLIPITLKTWFPSLGVHVLKCATSCA